MAKHKKISSIGLALFALILGLSPLKAFSAGGDLFLIDSNVYFSTSYFVEDISVIIYATAGNNSSEDLLGTIKFWNDTYGYQIGADQPISALAGSTDTVFINWTPDPGTQQISISVTPWTSEGDDPSNNTIWETITVLDDSDSDGVPNTEDTDDDNDGYPDYEDDFPKDTSEWHDTDGDGSGDNTDTDDDNDSVTDESDEMPLDYDETTDTDGDGIGNNKDADDDGDSIDDIDESETGTDPLNSDSDNDSYSDSEDSFPTDSEEWIDFDEDGIGDNTDTDDDDDSTMDPEDIDDHNKGPTIKINEPNWPFYLTGQDLTFDASVSYDEDGEIKEYKWVQGGSTISVNDTLETSYLKSGTQTIELVITDNKGETRSEQLDIRIYSKSFLLFLGLFITILLILAFYIIFKYNPRARAQGTKDDRHSKTSKKIRK
ncbi:MAG: ATPase [Candidatus Peregrinibacteria bacterium GW2011_GWF2_43_17]|nr:MAG: ATPase [Candidatus Peregrinibacteria bacterium GW2011_GWF2_43_17]KKT20321.1 MAG: hypothetical protein UW03_C0006G0056 [Candidatus Peregrinibacteria bacterium GW2011_GWA2_43_8]HAU39423.1 hypothetical protein [Candidatus Peregrinibacteria bacterium]